MSQLIFLRIIQHKIVCLDIYSVGSHTICFHVTSYKFSLRTKEVNYAK